MKKNKSTDLTALLPRARSGDQEAQLAIVTAFRPLVQKLAGQEKIPPCGWIWPASWCWGSWKPSGNTPEKTQDGSPVS